MAAREPQEVVLRFVIQVREEGNAWKPAVLHDAYAYAPRFDTRSDVDTMLELLAYLGVDIAQGFFIARPLTSRELDAFLEDPAHMGMPTLSAS